jgi:hypothetical protein
MEQAQFGVLEIDWFIASLQPMRWIKSLAGVHAPAGGAHILLPATSVNHCASAFFGQPMGHSPAIADSRVGSRVGQRSSRCPTARRLRREIQFSHKESNIVRAARFDSIVHNFFEMFLRARRALEQTHLPTCRPILPVLLPLAG